MRDISIHITVYKFGDSKFKNNNNNYSARSQFQKMLFF